MDPATPIPAAGPRETLSALSKDTGSWRARDARAAALVVSSSDLVGLSRSFGGSLLSPIRFRAGAARPSVNPFPESGGAGGWTPRRACAATMPSPHKWVAATVAVLWGALVGLVLTKLEVASLRILSGSCG